MSRDMNVTFIVETNSLEINTSAKKFIRNWIMLFPLPLMWSKVPPKVPYLYAYMTVWSINFLISDHSLTHIWFSLSDILNLLPTNNFSKNRIIKNDSSSEHFGNIWRRSVVVKQKTVVENVTCKSQYDFL